MSGALALSLALLITGGAPAFEDGVRLAREGGCFERPVADPGTCDDAVRAFERAVAENPPALGALRNAALIHAAMGRYASAVEAYRTLVELAPADPDPERQLWAKFAAEEADALEPLVATLQIDTRDAEVEFELDGRVVAPGIEHRLDGGTHRVVVNRGGVAVDERVLEIADGEQRSFVWNVAPPTAPSLPPPPAEARARVSRFPLGGLIVVGSGLAVTATGLGLGLGARLTRDAHCSEGRCDPGGLRRARAFADASTALTVVGSAAVVGGVVWLVVGRHRARGTSAGGGRQ